MTATINGKPIATVGSIATHPQSPDVVIEGAPGILLNGIPIAFSTGKTALGGALIPNTSVKISTAAPSATAAVSGPGTPAGVTPASELPAGYVGFAAAPRVENEEERQETIVP